MRKMKHVLCLALLVGGAGVMVGCSSSPAVDDTKPMKAGDGSQKPTAAGATGAGGGGAASGSGATSAQ